MSQIVSPKTNKLVRVGSKNFTDLLKDPEYREYLLNPDSPKLAKGRVSPSGSPPFERKSLSSLKNRENKLPPLPPISENKAKLPLLSPISPSENKAKLPLLSPISPSENKAKLPLLPPLSSGKTLHDLPLSPSVKIPLSPSLKMIYSPPSPSPSLKNIPMPVLPPLIPLKTNLPPLKNVNSKTLPSLPSLPFAKIPTLEETLERTRQPAKRAQLEEMIEEHREEEGRGIKTRGWGARSPTRGKERHQLKEECGDACFLLPEKEKFPICASPRMSDGVSKCEVDCGGVQSALIRARQWGYDDVASKAEKMLDHCKKEGLKHFKPTPIELQSPKSSRENLPSPRLQPSLRMGGKMDTEKEDYGVIRRNVRRSILLDNGVDDEENHIHRNKKNPPEPSCGCGK